MLSNLHLATTCAFRKWQLGHLNTRESRYLQKCRWGSFQWPAQRTGCTWMSCWCATSPPPSSDPSEALPLPAQTVLTELLETSAKVSTRQRPCALSKLGKTALQKARKRSSIECNTSVDVILNVQSTILGCIFGWVPWKPSLHPNFRGLSCLG